MSCFGNCIPKPDAYAKDIVAKMKKTASEGGDILSLHDVPGPPYCVPASCVLYVPGAQGSHALYVHRTRTSPGCAVRTTYRGNPGDIMEEHGAELVRAMAAGELVLDVLHLHDVFSSHKDCAQHLDRETCVQRNKLPTVPPMGSLLDELRTSPVDLHHEVTKKLELTS